MWFGLQAFYEKKTFNANIGAWNTASVSSMAYVCAAFPARAACHCGGTRSAGSSMRRGLLCAAAPARAHVCVCADVWASACAGAHVCRYSCA